MADLQDVLDLKKRVERLQREADHAAGALSETMKQLSKEFQCRSLEDAEEKLKQLKKAEAKAQASFEKALAEFEKEFEDDLSSERPADVPGLRQDV
jgi:DNA repair ATPase RecN